MDLSDEKIIRRDNWNALKKGYDLWEDDLFVAYVKDVPGSIATCSLVTGEILYWGGSKLMSGKKYCSAGEFYTGGLGKLTPVTIETVTGGDIMVVDPSHVEIVYEVYDDMETKFFTIGTDSSLGNIDGPETIKEYPDLKFFRI